MGTALEGFIGRYGRAAKKRAGVGRAGGFAEDGVQRVGPQRGHRVDQRGDERVDRLVVLAHPAARVGGGEPLRQRVVQRDEAREREHDRGVGTVVGEHVELVGEAGQLAQGQHVVGAEGLVAVALEPHRLGGAGRGVELLGREIERHVADGGSVCGVGGVRSSALTMT